ncbi:MAG: hypothetical protein NVS9B3_14710 [Gemmatimonadaceae bacterium]
MRPYCLPLVAIVAIACTSTPPHTATPAPERAPTVTGGFVVRLGRDTVSVERYTRTPSRLEGEVVLRAPRTRRAHYVADLTPAGTVSRFDFDIRSVVPAANAPRNQGSLIFGADSVTVQNRVNDSMTVKRLALRETTFPYLSGSLGVTELLTVRARSRVGDTTDVAVVPAGAAQLFPVRLIRVGADSVTVAVGGSTTPARARVDAQGRILGQQALASTQKFIVERVGALDLDSIAGRFSAREMGMLSPTDTVVGTVGGAHVTVTYSRPARRGRTIFGTVVPFGEVWRTGANAATVLRTDAPLSIGGLTVPAGAYTLFTIPRADGWTLIVNKQVGQWGTQYNPAQDLGRAPMTISTDATPTEMFTIGIRPDGGAGHLELAWDTTRATVAVAPR